MKRFEEDLEKAKQKEEKKRLEEDIKLSAFEKGLDISNLTLSPTKVKQEFGVFRKHKHSQNEEKVYLG
jgi:hypothetical protein